MEFWRAALSVAGLGAIGAFTFWSLYRQWFKLAIFQTLTKKQLYNLFLLFFVLTFLFGIASLGAYVLMNNRREDRAAREAAAIAASVLEQRRREDLIGLMKSREARLVECLDSIQKSASSSNREWIDSFRSRVVSINAKRIEAVRAGNWAQMHELSLAMEQLKSECSEKKIMLDLEMQKWEWLMLASRTQQISGATSAVSQQAAGEERQSVEKQHAVYVQEIRREVERITEVEEKLAEMCDMK